MKKDAIDIIKKQWNNELPDLETESMVILGRLQRVAKYAEKRLAKNFSTYQMNSGEFDVLATLLRSGNDYTLTPTELYHSLMITSGAMTNRIDTLEKKGYVKRIRNSSDRRVVSVQLTPLGESLISKSVYSHVETESQLLSALSKQEQQQLDQLLKKLLAAFDETKQ